MHQRWVSFLHQDSVLILNYSPFIISWQLRSEWQLLLLLLWRIKMESIWWFYLITQYSIQGMSCNPQLSNNYEWTIAYRYLIRYLINCNWLDKITITSSKKSQFVWFNLIIYLKILWLAEFLFFRNSTELRLILQLN